jgi:4-amino-4-deoxy-L-arabinose transferase-like glycosyltransferase
MRHILAHKLSFVLIICAALRIGVLLGFPGVFNFDATGQIHGSDAYDVYALNLLDTGIYGRTPGEPDAAIPPLYNYVLAGLYATFGRGYLPIGLFHTLLDLLSITLLYHIAVRLFPRGDWVGALAGLFYAGYPYLIFQNLTLIDTPLFMLLLHAFLLAVVLLREREKFDGGTAGLAALAGLALGLATLTRPILLPLVLLIGLWFLLRFNVWETIARLLPAGVVSLALLLPWVARNYEVYGVFVPMSLTAGSNFYQGNNPDVIPYILAGYDPQWTGPDALIADPYSPEGDRERSALAWAYLNDNRDQIPQLLWLKFLTHWSIDIFPRRNPVEGELPRLDYQGDALVEVDEGGALELGGLPPGDPVAVYAEPLFDQIGRTLHRYYYGVLFGLSLLGIALSLRQWRAVSLLWFVQISMTVVYVLFHPSTRYRVPTDPLLFLFAGFTLAALFGWWQRRRVERLVVTPIVAEARRR